MPYRKRIGIGPEAGPDYVWSESYEEIARFIKDAITSIKPNRPIYNADKSAKIAPNLLSLIIQETSMVCVLEKEEEDAPNRRLAGVGIAVAHEKYHPSLVIPNTAQVIVFALEGRLLRHETDEKALLMTMSTRARQEGYTGGIINEPVFTNK